MSRAVEILRAARDLLVDPERWTTGDYAKDADGEDCDLTGGEAVCWCAEGALWKSGIVRGIIDLNGWSPAYAWLTAAAKELGHEEVVSLNDGTDHATVLRMFDLAIARAGAS